MKRFGWQRMLSFVLALVMVLSMFPAGVFTLEANAAIVRPTTNKGDGSSENPSVILSKDGQRPKTGELLNFCVSEYGFSLSSGGVLTDYIKINNVEYTASSKTDTSDAPIAVDTKYGAQNKTWFSYGSAKYFMAKTYHEFTIAIADPNGVAAENGITTSGFVYSATDQITSNGAIMDFTKDSFPLTLTVPMPAVEEDTEVSVSVTFPGGTRSLTPSTDGSTASVTIPYTEGATTSGTITVTYQEKTYHTVTLQSNLSSGVTYKVTNVDNGEAVDPSKVYTDTNISLSAAGPDGATFLRWWKLNSDGSAELVADPSSVTIAGDVTYVAVFQTSDSPAIIKNTKNDALYTEYEKYWVFKQATSGDVLCLLTDVTLDQNVTINSGVTLLVPYADDNYAIGNVEGYPNANTEFTYCQAGIFARPDDENACFRTLTVGENVTVTVNGSLVVGGRIDSAEGGTGPTGVTSGEYAWNADNTQVDVAGGMLEPAFGKVVLSPGSNLNVTGGIVSACGYIVGDGTVNLTSGALYEPMIIVDVNGGTYSAVAGKGLGIASFLRFTMLNVQSTINLTSSSTGGKIYGYGNLYGGEKYNPVCQLLVAASGALLNVTGTAKFTFDPSKAVDAQLAPVDYHTYRTYAVEPYIGRTTVELNGSCALGSFELTYSGVTVNTGDMHFAVPYNFEFKLMSGTFTMNNPLKVMPGAVLYVANGAKMVVNSSLYIFDGLTEHFFANTLYPMGDNLGEHFSERGLLIVDGTLEINGEFGGIVDSYGNTGVIKVASGADLEVTGVIQGASGGDSLKILGFAAVTIPDVYNSKTFRDIPARLFNGTEMVTMATGTTYYASEATANQENDIITGYSYTDRDNTPFTVEYGEGNAILYGQWHTGYTVTFYDGTTQHGDPVTYIPNASVTTPNMSRAGYTLTGFKDQDGNLYTATAYNGVATFSNLSTPRKNLVLTAQWTPNTNTAYKVETYVMGTDGNYPATATTTENKSDTTDTTATYTPEAKTGFTVADSSVLSGTIAGDGSLVLKVYYKRNQYTLTTVVDGVETTTTYYYEQAVTAPANPSKTGYTFAGWDGTAPNTMPADNVTLTAQWTAISCDVTYIVDGAEKGTFKVAYDSEYNHQATAPTKVGYTFAGWYTAATGGTKVEATDKMTTAGAHTLYAQWTPNANTAYTVNIYEMSTDGAYPTTPTSTENKTGITDTKATYEPTDREGFTVDTTQSVTSGTIAADGSLVLRVYYSRNQRTVTWKDGDSVLKSEPVYFGAAIPGYTPTKEGHTFASWDQPVTTMPDNDVTFSANWTVNQYDVAWVAKGGTITSENGTYTVGSVAYGTAITAPVVSRTGYTFDGWYTDEAYTKEVTNFSTMPANNVTYYAKWIANTDTQYTVEIFVMGLDGQYAKESSTTYTGTTDTTANYTAVTREGFTVDTTKSVTSGTIAGAGSLVLRVYYSRNQHTLTTVVDGVETKTTYYYGATVSVEAPSKTGYTFAGWNPVLPATMPDNDVAAIATWTVNKYTVTWDVDGVETTDTCDFGAKITAPADPTKTGYTFAGWSPAVDTTMPAKNVTYTATWTVNHYTVAWIPNGGTITSAEDAYTEGSVAYGTTITAPAVSRPGYTFAGWSPAVADTVPAEKVTYTATWTVNRHNVSWIVDDEMYNTTSHNYNETIVQITAPTKTGHTFAGWKAADGTVYAAGASMPTMPDEDVTYTATWTVNQYTITFNTAGGSTIAAIKQDYGSDITKPGDPTKTGYTFAGWDKEIPATMPAENITITAQWTINQYTITFVTDGGTAIDPITQDYSSTVTAPADPTKEGYTFAGWDKAVPATMPAENVTITASWNINQYTITFDTDGGSLVDPITQDYNTAVTAPANPTKEGYTFAGWVDAEGNSTTVPSTMPAGNVTIKATWTANQYTITFDTDGGTAIDPITQDYSSTVTAPADPTKEGYTFAGWDKAVPAIMPAENVTITAQWTINQYTITFDTDGGTAIDPITQDYSSAVTAPADPTKEGYTFAGWSPVVPATMPAGNVIIKATWTANQYTITFDSNGGSDVADITQDYGTAVTVPTDPTKTGYSFAGWDKAVPATMPAENVTIKAQWTINQYTISFNSNGGSAVAAITQNYNTTVAAPAAPTKAGYTFAGWYDANGNLFTFTTMPAESLVLTAQWTANTDTPVTVEYYEMAVDGSYPDAPTRREDMKGTTDTATSGLDFGAVPTGFSVDAQKSSYPTIRGDGTTVVKVYYSRNTYNVTWNVDGATTVVPYRYGANVVTIGDPSKVGHTFAGWDKTVTTMPAEHVNITATWTVINYQVIWNIDGAKTEETYAYGATINTPTDPTKTGYTFSGWNPEVVAIMPATDKTYTATWTANTYTVTLDLNGGALADGVSDTVTVTFGSAYALPAPTRTGYAFTGWYLDDVRVDTDGVNVATAEDHTLIAQWDANLMNYTVEYYVENLDGNGYTLDATQTLAADYGTTTDITEGLAIPGFTFDSSKTVNVTIDGVDDVAKVYYNRNSYTITFDTDGGSTIAAITGKYGSDIAAPAVPTKTGYSFASWDQEIPATMPAGDMTITASWNINQYTITFNTAGGTEIAAITQDYGTAVTAPANPTKTGHTFAGWDKDIPATMPAQNVTITAQWTVDQYTITFNTAGGSEIAAITQDYGTAVTAPVAPTKTGYNFTGWDKEIPATMPAGDMTITASWSINQYTITFDTDGGSAVAAITLNYGEDVTAPAAPTKTGHTFAGWNQEIPATMPAEDVTITATWTVNQYTITFNTAGGTEIAAITQNYGTAVTAPAAPTKTGYSFAGWDKEIPATMPAGDMTVTASWNINQYTITFDTAGGNTIAAITQNYGTAVTAPADPTKTGHTFAGWDQDIPETMPAGDMTITAQWTVNAYTITFDSNGGSAVAAITQDYGTAVTAPAAPTKEGYTFTGWSPAVPGTMPAGNVTLTAQWSVNQYTVTFDSNGGSAVAAITQNYGTAVNKSADPKKEGYTFLGWYSGTGADAVEVNFPMTMPENGVTVYAKWQVNTYTVTWNVDGEKTTASYAYGAAITAPADPAKEGYTFSGWSPAVDATMPAKNVTYTATWTANGYTVTFDTTTGTAVDNEAVADQNQTYDSTSIQMPAADDVSKTGYTLTGWTDGTTSYEPGTTITNNLASSGAVTLSAQWTANQYTIVFHANGGEGTMTSQSMTYDTPADLTNNTFTKVGYHFVGWTTVDPNAGIAVAAEGETEFTNGQQVSNLTAQNNGTVTLFAKWEVNTYTVVFDPNGGSGTMGNQTFTYAVGQPLNANAFTKTGYHFIGWKYTSDTLYNDSANFTVTDSTLQHGATITLTAQWASNTNTAYTVNHHLANLDGTTYTVETTTHYGTTDTTVDAPVGSFSGFAAPAVQKVTILPDGSASVDYYYTRESYTVTWNVDGTTTTEEVIFGAAITKPADPAKGGYTFAGWSPAVPDTMPANNVIYTAQWMVNQYTITFDTEGGSDVAAITQNYGTAVTAPADPTKEGYTFAGWDTEIPETMPAGDMTITASWTINQYTITFDTDGGNTIAAITQDYNTAVTAPADPTRAGYTFAGWSAEIPETMPAGNVTIKATWTINQYTITFDTDGGSTVAAITQDYGAAITAPADPTREGHTFVGWSPVVPDTMPAEDMTVTAQWTVNSYTVTWIVEGVPTEVTYAYGAQIQEPAAPSKEGYTFTAWDKAIPDTMPAGNLTFTAQFRQNTYTVVFHSNGGTGEMTDKTYTYDIPGVLTANAFSRVGHTFAGWNTQADGQGTAYTNGAAAKNLTATDGAVVDLYAQWTPITRTVSFYSNGGTGSMGTMSIVYDAEAKPLLDNAFVRNGYTFTGWNTQADGNGAAYAPNADISNLTENLVLYAQWTPNTYTVVFHANQGAGEMASLTVTFDQAGTLPANTFTRTGYSFNGWNTQADGSGTPYADAAQIQNLAYEGEVVLYAQWRINQYIITFDTAGGSAVGAITQDYGSAVTAPADPTRVAYRFDGWDTEIPETMPAENITITAQWTSYLDILVAIDPVDFANAESERLDHVLLDQAREIYNIMAQDPTQLATYETQYVAHREQLMAEIKEVSLLELEESVESDTTISNVNATLDDNEAGGKIAVVYMNGANNYAEVCLETESYPAASMLGIPFLTELFNMQDIYSVDFPALRNETDKNGDPLTPYGSGVDTLQQLDLMLRIAYATINEPEITGADGKMTYPDFFDWLYAKYQADDGSLVIGVLDGKGVEVAVNAVTVEGVEYSTTYYISFYNRDHDITWDSADGSIPETETYSYGDVVTIPAPVREGYTFLGWQDAQGNAPVATMGKTDVTYTAQWQINQYTITFDTDGGTEFAAITAQYGTPITNPGEPEKEGYAFQGWSEEIPTTMPAEDMTITAQWQINGYTITFDTVDGTAIAPISQDYGTAVTAPADPTKTGYTFAGWDVQIPETMPAKDMTITASWTANTYVVTLDAAGGTITGDAQLTVTYDQQYNLPTATRPGYTFAGWYMDGTKVESTDAVKITADATLIAQWDLGEADSITYDLADGAWPTGASVVNSYNVNTPSFTLPEPVREGYTFVGWTGSNGTIPEKTVVVETGSVGALNFTANWQINQYTITFDAAGGSAVAAITLNYGEAVTAPADPTREGYTFTGWDKTIPATMPAGDMTITATWKINTYTITFDTDGGSAVAAIKQNYGTAVTAPAAPTKEGYTFIGWDMEVPATMPAGDMTITAMWEANTYTVTFVTNGGSEVAAITLNYGEVVTAPADPTREGYTFAGWDKTIPTTMPAGDMTITASWSVNSYRLVYKVDGEVYKEMTLNYGSTVAQMADPEKEGYTFSGWSQQLVTMPAQDVEIAGTFSPNLYTITFDPNYPAADQPQERQVTFDGTYGELPVPQRTGYVFAGWTLNGEAITAESSVKTASDHTLTAQWTANRYTVTLVPNGGSCETATIQVTYDSTYAALPVPVREGYDFIGWFDGETQVSTDTRVTITADQTLTARWNASGDTPYVVNHYQQNLTGGYTLVDTENFTGATDTEAHASQKSYTGFSFNAAVSSVSGIITADGKLVLNLYYDRDSYTVVWNVGTQVIRETYAYGQTLNVPNTAIADDLHAAYTFTGWDTTLPETVAGDATYTAQYELCYEAMIGDVTYRTLGLALENAKSGETVVLVRDVTMTENLTVPAGVLLLLPCMDNDVGYTLRNNGKLLFNHDGTSTAGQTGVGPEAHLYRKLTIPEGITLNVEGTVLINAVTGRPTSGNNDQDVTGGYAQIDLNGNIVVKNSGIMDSFGYVKGNGQITVENGGSVGDLYIVRHWRGGTQGLKMYEANVYPMNEYDCHNIEVDVRVEYGGTYEGMVKMYAGDQYNYTRYPQIDISNGLIRLDPGAYVIRSYESGREIYRIYGDADFASSTLNIVGVDLTTAEFLYPIDGDISFELHGGRYDFVNDYKFMPGCEVLVGGDAQLYVAVGHTVVFYREFNDLPNTSSTQYPSNRGPAVLSIAAGGKFTNAGTFSGHIYTESPNILIGSNPLWQVQTREANGYATDAINRGEETWVPIDHDLTIDRPGHTWHYGADNSIVWDGTADYAKVQQAIASIPEDLSYYYPESTIYIQPALDQVVYGLPVEQQAEVDAMAQPILDAVDALELLDITITFDPNGGTMENNTIVVKSICNLGTMPKPTRPYYNFLGWYDQDGNRVKNNDDLMTKTDITLTARWEVQKASYTAVNRALRRVPKDEELHKYSGESVAILEAAINGVDWNLTADRQAEVDAMAQAIVDATANLELRKVSVNLDANGGTVDPTAVNVTYTQTMGELPTPVREGYTFAGWVDASGQLVTAETVVDTVDPFALTATWTIKSYTITFDTDGGSQIEPMTGEYGSAVSMQTVPVKNGYTFVGWTPELPATMPGQNLTVTAVWKPNSYTITFDTAGGSEIPAIEVAYGSVIPQTESPTKTGYTFQGWNQKIPETMPANNLTLTAVWKPDTYTITFDTDGGSEMAAISVEYGSAIKMSTVPTKVGYTFAGWEQDIPDTMPAKDLTLKAVWEAKSYVVTLDPAGGVLADGNTVTVTYDGTYQLPVPEKQGDTFLGWYLNGVLITDTTVVKITEPATVVAHWENDTVFTVTYDLVGGYWVDGTSVVEEFTAATSDFVLPIPVRDNYLFVGWTGSNGDVPTVEVVVSTGIAEDLNYTANWLPYYEIILHEDSNAEIDHIEVIVYDYAPMDRLTLSLPVALPDTRNAEEAPDIHVTIPENVVLRLIVPLDGTEYYGNVFMELSDANNPVLIPETQLTDNGVYLLFTENSIVNVVENSIIFPDVPDGFWAKNEIDYMSSRRFMLGKLDGTCMPYETITRATIVMMLWRLEGEPVVENLQVFPDVSEDNRYAQAIAWAAENGIVQGYPDGTFRPLGELTRLHLVAILHRYAQYKGFELEQDDTKNIEDFADYDLISPNLRDSAQWGYATGVLQGRNGNLFDPNGSASRGQLSVILYRYLERYYANLERQLFGSIGKD